MHILRRPRQNGRQTRPSRGGYDASLRAAAPAVPPHDARVGAPLLADARKSNREMAIISGISTRTVDKHLQHVFEKMDVGSRHAAVVQAIEALQPT